MPVEGLQFYPHWLTEDEATELYRRLRDEIPWQQDNVKVFGKWHFIPRLQSWHGDKDTEYRYSGKALAPRPWTPGLTLVRDKLSAFGIYSNSVLCNLYRNGKDKMGWHRDNEPELGDDPIIASVSLGAERDFKLRHKVTNETYSLKLLSGSLLIMQGDAQRNWEHSLPARMKVTEPRINLTFRTVYNNA